MRLILLLLFGLTVGGCATTGAGVGMAENDPYERFNRGIWEFNQAVDTVAIKPATTVYRTVTPVPARRGIRGILNNLSEPFNFINNLLQGKPERAFNSLGRFVINSTIGVGGLADHATDLGLPPTDEDFGQTLAVAGAKESPYLVLPLLGPSTVRDAVGTAVTFVADPARIVLNHELTTTQEYVVSGSRILDARSGLIEGGVDAVLESSADPYATARSAYFQRREAAIRDEEAGAGTLTVEEENQLLDDALEEAIPIEPAVPEEQPETEPPAPEEQPATESPAPEQDSPSVPETALLDRLPDNVLMDGTASGGE